ncbi:RnfH family protein [Candidatus Marithrix sp. Canyon 246]|nr:RnfH family protein [Candidatus Marithrix sp. Canyon 246]
MENNTIDIEVAYAKPEEQMIISLKVASGCTAEEAIEKSDILSKFPEIELKKIGIFSKPCSLKTQLRESDRVEIYRPLIADPKELRKQRAAQGKVMKKGGNK